MAMKRLPFKHISPMESYVIASKYRDGIKIKEICTQHKCARSVVLAHAAKHDVPRRMLRMEMRKMTSKQKRDAKLARDKQLIADIQTLESFAHARGLHVTAHALNRAKNALGWEIAGNIEEAGKAAFALADRS